MTRRALAVIALLAAWPVVASMQHKTTAPGGIPNQLTSEEFERLMTRAMGTWVVNWHKSTIMSGDTLGVVDRYLYERTADGKGVKVTRGDERTSLVQNFDGKPYGPPARTVARIPIDESTIDNVIGVDGRRQGRNTHVFSPDGTKSVYIMRNVNPQGDETVFSVIFFEKAPK